MDLPLQKPHSAGADVHGTLLSGLAELSASSHSLEDALRVCLGLVCRVMGWSAGHAYVPAERGAAELVSTAIWHVGEGHHYDQFREVTENSRFGYGVGMPGRIWEKGEPLWVADVEADRLFLRSKRPDGVGVKSAFGFPVKDRDRVIAVLEFFSKEPIESDPTLIIDAIGSHLGRIFERVRAEEKVRDHSRTVETINRINLSLAAELNLDRLVQAVTDAATEAVEAAFGAFFYNVINADGEAYMLYTLSGVPREAFAKFPMPRNTAIFEPTFRGHGVLRLDDVTQDPRYGKNPPHHGMPKGHLPVRSYLAVPVISRSGEVMGGLFFGHPEPRMFTQQHERIAAAIAVQAAIGIDNARVYRQAEEELAERKRVEQHQELLLAELNHRVKNMLAVVTAMAAQTMRASRSLDEFSAAFSGRLDALARTYSLLTSANWDETPLKAVIREAVAPYGGTGNSSIELAGPDVLLRPKAALTIAMILHELTTNAAKHGALAATGGRLAVTWSLERPEDDKVVRLRWRESGLHGLRPPTYRGFGTTMIEASVEYELGGRVDTEYRDDGVEYDLRFPVRDGH